MYHIIIIGAGITGLSTGLAWTRVFDPVQHPVLIIEKEPAPGGCVTTFARNGYRFDTVQIIPDISRLLSFFGFGIDLVRFDPVCARLFLVNPSTSDVRIFPVASRQEDFENQLIRWFPDDGRAIRSFFRYCNSMHGELRFLKIAPGFADLLRILFNCRKILANSGRTYQQLLKSFRFGDPDLYEILDIFSSFSGLSGNRCASLLTACAMVTTLKGSYRPTGGFIQFPLQLRKEIEKRGGEFMFGTKVSRIIFENGRARGVELQDGRILMANYVVSTADTQLTLGEMTGYGALETLDAGYSRKASQCSMSPSCLSVHLGLDDDIDLKGLGFDCGYNVLTTGQATHAKMFDHWEKGELFRSDEDLHLGVISPSAILGGKPTLIIQVVPCPANPWISMRNTDYGRYRKEKEDLAQFYISKVEQYMIPGLRDHIRFMDVSTPATYARYLGSPTGSTFDMMPVPGNFGKNRLGMKTPVKNLFLPKFSHGIWPSMQAGLQVVDCISGGKIMKGFSSYG